MRFDIENFKSFIDTNDGFAKPSRFFVSFVPPPLLYESTDFRNTIEFYCEAVNLPGFQLQVSEARRYTYGPAEKRPFGPTFPPLQMIVLADNAGKLWKFFHAWMNYINPHTVKDGIGKVMETSLRGNRIARPFPYELEYKDNYMVDLAIYHLPEIFENSIKHPTDQPHIFDEYITRTICRDCFPSTISDIQLSWADNNNIARFQVQMEYLEWYNSNDYQ